jgi:MYXO-CTERM domain-containing protein
MIVRRRRHGRQLPSLTCAALGALGVAALVPVWTPPSGAPRPRVGAPTSPSVETRPPPAPSFDPGPVKQQVQLAFREQPDGSWSGGPATYDVTVREGAVEVTPYHHPGGRDQPVEGDAVRFAPAAITRGAAILAPAARVTRGGVGGELELVAAAVTERIRNGPRGVERSWTFAGAPPGSGDLEVRLAVDVGGLAAETEAGVHLTAGTLGVSHGHGTWIDARGEEATVPARWEEGAIVLRVPASVLDGSAYPAVLDPVIGPEAGVGVPVLGPALTRQSSPSVAWSGSSFLVVWNDERLRRAPVPSLTYPPPGNQGLYATDVFGARVSPAGAVLDPQGILIGRSSGGEPALAWDTDRYLVVWPDAGATVLLGARVADTGDVLDLDPIAIGSLREGSTDRLVSAAVASCGNTALVTWNADWTVRGARVGHGAEVLDPYGGFPISASDTVRGERPALAWDGTNCLVAWADAARGSVAAARVDPAGHVLDRTALPGCDDLPAIAYDGTNHLVVCRAADGIRGTRVSAAGTVLDPGGFLVTTDRPVRTAVAWDGANHLVAWEPVTPWPQVPATRAMRVSAAGASLGTVPLPAGARGHPGVAWSGTTHLVVWDTSGSVWDQGADVVGARVAPDGTVLDASGAVMSTSMGEQRFGAAAWNGTSHLVVWIERGTVYGARVSAEGVFLDHPGFVIGTGAGGHPAVAARGTEFLVIWLDGTSSVRGARVSADGVVVDPAGLKILDMSTMGDPESEADGYSVASNGRDWLVVVPRYTHHYATRGGGHWYTGEVYAARVSGAGENLDPQGIRVGAVANSSVFAVQTSVASDGTGYLVAWDDAQLRHILASRVVDGRPLDGAGLEIGNASNSARPTVAWDGSRYLVVWVETSPPTTDRHAVGVRVDPDGAIESGPILGAASNRSAASVAGNGVTVWQVEGDPGTVSGGRICGCLLGGSIGDPLFVATAVERAVVVSSGPQQALIVYDAFDASLGARRVRARSLATDPCPVLPYVPYCEQRRPPAPAPDPSSRPPSGSSSSCGSAGGDAAPLGVLGLLALAAWRRSRRASRGRT